jgi:hypothetical protein
MQPLAAEAAQPAAADVPVQPPRAAQPSVQALAIHAINQVVAMVASNNNNVLTLANNAQQIIERVASNQQVQFLPVQATIQPIRFASLQQLPYIVTQETDDDRDDADAPR